MKNITTLLLILILFSCDSTKHTEKKDLGTPDLINWSKEFVAHHELDDWSYYEDHDNFISDYFSVKYEKEQIVATTLMEINCSDSVIGTIKVSNDTIYLSKQIIMTDDRLCSEFHKFKYVITNPAKKRYIFASLK